VFDRDGRPVHGAEVHLYLPGGQAGWYDYGYTDEEGLRAVTGFPADAVLAGIIHPDHGKRFGIEVDLAGAPDPLVLAFDEAGELRVRLVEGGQPRPGVQVRVLGGSGTYIVGWVTSDAEGVVRLPDLGAGTYDFSVLHPGYWQETRALPLRPGDPPVDLAVHRLGALRLRATTTGGAPVTGLAVELEHAELGPVSAWVTAGRVEAPEGGLVTGPDGRLELAGVPAGTYAWRAAAPSGLLQGEGIVFPGQGGELRLIVP